MPFYKILNIAIYKIFMDKIFMLNYTSLVVRHACDNILPGSNPTKNIKLHRFIKY